MLKEPCVGSEVMEWIERFSDVTPHTYAFKALLNISQGINCCQLWFSLYSCIESQEYQDNIQEVQEY